MSRRSVPRCSSAISKPGRNAIPRVTFGLIILAHAAVASAATGPESPSKPDAVQTGLRRSTDELVQLHVTSAGYGMLTGLWLHELSDGDSAWTLTVPAAAVGTLSVGAITWLDRSPGLSFGLPQAIVTDAFIGFEIASAWVWHFRTANGPTDEWSAAQETTLVWGGTTLGASVGVLRYALSPSPPGHAAFTGSVTLWSGALSGLLAAALTSESSQRDDNASQATALGLEAGVILGSYAGRFLRPSLGWVRALDAGALLGGVLFGGTYLSASGRSVDDRAAMAIGAGGIGAGLLCAALLAPKLGLPRASSFVIRPDIALGEGTNGVSIHGAF